MLTLSNSTAYIKKEGGEGYVKLQLLNLFKQWEQNTIVWKIKISSLKDCAIYKRIYESILLQITTLKSATLKTTCSVSEVM